jgi:hypothetical protein
MKPAFAVWRRRVQAADANNFIFGGYWIFLICVFDVSRSDDIKRSGQTESIDVDN